MTFFFKQVWILFFVLLLAPQSEASNGKRFIKCADKLVLKKYFAPAADAYEKALQCKKFPADSVMKVKEKLAAVYMKTGNTIKAESNYADVVKAGNANSDVLFGYGRSLQSNEKYADAIGVFDVLAKKENGSSKTYEGFSFISKKALLGKASSNKIQSLALNTNESEYAPCFYNKGLVFTSSRFTSNQPSHRIQWNRVLFTDLYSVQEDSKGALTLISKLPSPLNSKLNDGAATFNKMGDEIFFTRNNKKLSKRNELQILVSKYNGTDWSEPKVLNFENSNTNYAHPFLSQDGNTLYFASDMSGGMGGMDLYETHRNGDVWETPTNLGKSINTSGNEIFPFLAEDGVLYFTSDGHAGYGGLDIFSSRKEEKKFTEVTNLGFDINSSKDDLSFIADTKNGIAYFSSNRKGDDDIYTSVIETSASIASTLAAKKAEEKLRSGLVIDKATNLGIENARVELFNNGSSTNGRFFYTNDHGEFFFKGNVAYTDIIRVTKEKYSEKTVVGIVLDGADSSVLLLALDPLKVTVDSSFVINVFYDVAKSELNKEALDKLKTIKEQFKSPNTRIILNGFADEQGKSSYNYILSNRRAKAVEKYLVEQGFSPCNIHSNTYGAVKLEPSCRKQPKCFVETNKQNRRVELKVIKE